MKHASSKHVAQKILARLDVQINGSRPWDIQVNNPEFFNRVLVGGSLALGESYMDGWWRCEALDQLFDKILSTRIDKQVKKEKQFLSDILRAKIINAQSRSKAYIIGKRHYDIGNRLFSIMLDKRMNYSCGYWEKATPLDHAQEAKLDLICQKLLLKADGLFLLHTIAGNTSVHSVDPWISKYIFPNSMLPSAKQISSASERILVLEDWHCLGQYYDQTLMAWHQNFIENWEKVKDMYDKRFYRMWTYYLLSCAAGFRSRRNQLWQIVFSRKGIRGGHQYRGKHLYGHVPD